MNIAETFFEGTYQTGLSSIPPPAQYPKCVAPTQWLPVWIGVNGSRRSFSLSDLGTKIGYDCEDRAGGQVSNTGSFQQSNDILKQRLSDNQRITIKSHFQRPLPAHKSETATSRRPRRVQPPANMIGKCKESKTCATFSCIVTSTCTASSGVPFSAMCFRNGIK